MAYGIRERAVMIALAALGGECSNTELKAKYRLDLLKKFRGRLNSDGLIESRRESRSFKHVLTDKGWKYVETEMRADVPPRSGSAAGGLYALLAGLKPVAERAGGLKSLLSGDSPVQQHLAEPSGNLKDQVRAAYRALAKRPQDWVMLCELRPRLGNAAKSEVDSTLKRMFLDKEINLTLNDDQGSLTQADRNAAVRIGANDMHMLSMG